MINSMTKMTLIVATNWCNDVEKEKKSKTNIFHEQNQKSHWNESISVVSLGRNYLFVQLMVDGGVHDTFLETVYCYIDLYLYYDYTKFQNK